MCFFFSMYLIAMNFAIILLFNLYYHFFYYSLIMKTIVLEEFKHFIPQFILKIQVLDNIKELLILPFFVIIFYNLHSLHHFGFLMYPYLNILFENYLDY